MKHTVFITRKKKMNEAFRAVILKLKCEMSYVICKSAHILLNTGKILALLQRILH